MIKHIMRWKMAMGIMVGAISAMLDYKIDTWQFWWISLPTALYLSWVVDDIRRYMYLKLSIMAHSDRWYKYHDQLEAMADWFIS